MSRQEYAITLLAEAAVHGIEISAIDIDGLHYSRVPARELPKALLLEIWAHRDVIGPILAAVSA